MSLPTRQQVQEAHGAVLKTLRDGTTGLSQEQLAEASDTDRTYISLMEGGEQCPSLWIFIKVALALNIDPPLVLSMVLSMVLARLRGEL